MTRRKLHYCLCAIIVLLLVFIWGNSTLSGEESGAISSGLLDWLAAHFSFLKDMPELVLRKLGHLSEFAALGFFLGLYFRKQQSYHRITMPLLLGFAAANVDELIQVFSPKRGPSVVDVWIDMGGLCAGLLVLWLLLGIKRLVTKKP